MRDWLWRKRTGHYKGSIIGGLLCVAQVVVIAGWVVGLESLLFYLPVIPVFAWLDGRGWFKVDG